MNDVDFIAQKCYNQGTQTSASRATGSAVASANTSNHTNSRADATAGIVD